MAAARVLHVIVGLGRGGAETMLGKLLAATDRERFEPVVVTLMPGGELRPMIEALGVPVHDLGLKRGLPTPSAAWRLARLAHRLRPDLIQGWMYHGNLAASLAARVLSPRPPVLWNVRHSLHGETGRSGVTMALIRLGARLSAGAAAVIYNSRVSAGQHEALGYAADKTRVLPNGFDADRFRPDPKAYASVREELGWAPETKVIGLVARYHPLKDHATFLSAAARFEALGDWCFLLAGRDMTPENPAIMAQVRSLGLEGKVALLGERQDVPRLTAALDIGTNCSISEGFPNAVGEAMAAGIPCVVTDVGDSAWIVSDTGVVVAPGDPAGLAAAWRSLAALAPAERRALGSRARARVEAHFAIDAVTRDYEALYEGLLARKDMPCAE